MKNIAQNLLKSPSVQALTIGAITINIVHAIGVASLFVEIDIYAPINQCSQVVR